MEPGRFDDVEFRIVDEPSDPRPPRRPWRIGHTALAVIAAVVLTGTLAAGASALTSTAQAPTRNAAKVERSWSRLYHQGGCHRGDHRPAAAGISY
jgi:hypothetical protein